MVSSALLFPVTVGTLVVDGVLALGGLVAAGVASLAYQNRQRSGVRSLIALLAAIALWNVAHLLRRSIYLHDVFPEWGMVPLAAVKFLSLAALPPLFVTFVLAFTNREAYLGRRWLALVFSWPALLGLLTVSDLAGVGPGATVGLLDGVLTESGPFFWTYVFVSYGYVAVGTALLVQFVVHANLLFRRQGAALLFGLVALWGSSVVSLFELPGDVGVFVIPTGMVVTALSFLWAVTRADLADITPIARATVLESMDMGVVVADSSDRVTEVNQHACDALDIAEAEVLGEHVETALGDYPAVFAAFDRLMTEHDGDRSPPTASPSARSAAGSAAATSDGGVFTETTETVSVETPLGERTLKLGVSPLTSRGNCLGHVLIFADVTVEHRRQRELERQNERLEEFAGIVSHDLRNPLQVGRGNLELLDVENDRVENVAQAFERMEAIIDDTLTLAREGSAVESVAPVELSAVAQRAWSTVATEGATLSVETDATITADEARLRRLFENLFRNAVEHGQAERDTVSVRVGDLDDGFFVEDDGVGIPPGERDDVFGTGYTTAAKGTGFGLAIVADIAAAHGWDVTIAGGRDGGARFEIRAADDRAAAGLDRPDRPR